MGIDNVFAIPATSGDANSDGLADDNDLSLLLANWNRDVPWRNGNFTGDDVADDNDLSVLLANWTAAGEPVPEPLALTMLLLAGSVLAGGRRRRSADVG